MVLCKNTLPHDVRLYGVSRDVNMSPGEVGDVPEDIVGALPQGVRRVEVGLPKRKKTPSPKPSPKSPGKPSSKPQTTE